MRYWLHNGFVRINEEKMSKSLGNFFTVREILQHYQAEEVRYFILTSQYRSPLNYDEEHLQNARAALTRFYTALRGLPRAPAGGAEAFVQRFREAMDDDEGPNDTAIDALVQQRLDAKAAKNWGEADRIRDELKALGILLEDGPQGSTWRRA